MKLILLILLVTTSTFAQNNQNDAARKRAKEITEGSKVTTPTANNQGHYAADPTWRTATNQIAALAARSNKIMDQEKVVEEMARTKRNAKQSVTVERAELGKLHAQRKPIDQQIADLKVKKLQIEQRIDRNVPAK